VVRGAKNVCEGAMECLMLFRMCKEENECVKVVRDKEKRLLDFRG
jgi:hypothetical protein